MSQPDFHELVKQLASDNPDNQDNARQTLFALDEDAIDPLLDEYYAGVTEAQGVAILQILAEIGGYEALNALRNICFFDLTTRPKFRNAAAEGLQQNSDYLSPDEREKIAKILA